MKYQIHQTNIRTLKPGDPLWLLDDGMITSPRAGFEISQRCPKNYKDIILECVRYGWLMPVANMYDHEVTFDILKKG